MKQVMPFNYLGFTITSNGRYDEDIKKKKESLSQNKHSKK